MPCTQTSTREQKARPMLESIVEKIQHVLEHVCRDVQKQAQLYQESVRDQKLCRDVQKQAQLYQERVRDQHKGALAKSLGSLGCAPRGTCALVWDGALAAPSRA
eukprot:scaffold310965_cov19-Tisochrysis_lutea.AAC.1